MPHPLPFFVSLCLLPLLAGSAAACSSEAPDNDSNKPPKDLQVYLLIGQSNMAGRAQVPEDAAGVIDRCWLLNDKNQWVPAKNPLNLYSSIRKGEGMQRLGPGYGFALKMLKDNPDLHLGLVVNARGGSKIDQWKRDARYYKQSVERTKAAMEAGTLKGVLWHQGESDSAAPEAYLGKLETLIDNLRTDLGDQDLPFIAGQINNTPAMAINDAIAKLPDAVKHTGVVSSEGLTCTDRWHFDTKSQLLLGERYAEQVLLLRGGEEAKE